MDTIDSSITQIESLTSKAYELGLTYAPRLALAILTLLIGLWIISGITKLVKASMERSKVDPTPSFCGRYFITCIYNIYIIHSDEEGWGKNSQRHNPWNGKPPQKIHWE